MADTKKSKIEVLNIDDLILNLFVRKELDVEHAFDLAALVENGVELDPIVVASRGTIIDGRHRIRAYQENGRAEIRAIRRTDIDDDNKLAVIVAAYQANDTKGPLPPTGEDREHTVLMLLENGATKKSIAELLDLPEGMAKGYIKEIESKKKRAQLQKAASAVTEDGFTMPKAAEHFGCDVEALRALLRGGNKKRKNGEDNKRKLTQMCKSHSQRIAAVLKNQLEKFKDGEVTEDMAVEVFKHVGHLQKQASGAFEDWRKRFDALRPSKNKANVEEASQ